jgi:hypothetical protein
MPTLIDLREQPCPGLLGFPGGVRTWWNHLHEVVSSLGDRILAGVDPDREGTARQRVDGAAVASTGA